MFIDNQFTVIFLYFIYSWEKSIDHFTYVFHIDFLYCFLDFSLWISNRFDIVILDAVCDALPHRIIQQIELWGVRRPSFFRDEKVNVFSTPTLSAPVSMGASSVLLEAPVSVPKDWISFPLLERQQMFTLDVPVQPLALQEEVWMGSSTPSNAEGDQDTRWILLRRTKTTLFICIRSTVSPHDVIFRIENSIFREYLLIREHHSSNYTEKKKGLLKNGKNV